MFVFLVFSRAVCCVRVAAQAQAQAPRVSSVAPSEAGMRLLLPSPTPTSTYRITSRQSKPPLHLNTHTTNKQTHTTAPRSFAPFTFTDPLNKSWDPTQGHGVFGLVDSTNKTVGDTARHCDQGLLSFSLFPGSVCEHCLFLFCTLASVRIDHGTRADKRVGWDDGSLCSGAFSLTCTYSDKL